MANKYTKYVDVFYGNGEINLPKPEGIASTWLFLKARCGNTHPHAVSPFGKMSCGSYTGGYPTGYGNHKINYGGEIEKFDGKLQGFSHLHQTGTGEILVYYNYAIVSPMYGALRPIRETLENEYAEPGYYSVTLKESNIRAEITVNNDTAYHRYYFNGEGKIAVDFSNDGLERLLGERAFNLAENAEIKIESKNSTSACVTLHGRKLYFYVICIGDVKNTYLFDNYKKIDASFIEKNKREDRYGCAFDVCGDCEIRVSIAESCIGDAKRYAELSLSFENVRAETLKKWEDYLSKIEIDADEDTKRLFYSNFYHSIQKPSKWDNGYRDFATLWDLYKTQLPLVYTLYPKEAKGMINTLVKASDEYKEVPMALLQSAYKFVGSFAEQAKMLATYTAFDAFIRGICSADDVLHIAKNEIGNNPHEKINDLIKEGKYTHIMDMTGACRAAQYVARLAGSNDEELFKSIADKWIEAFDTDGLMKQCNCYEGSSWHYSFRLLPDMEQRILMCGSKENFVKLADEFFGYGKEPVTQYKDIDTEYPAAIALNRFDGINNEHDMEAPFVYLFAGRHDKTCEVIENIKKYMFTSGRGGLPGNNDTGALSSWYVWNTLGLFPATGQDKILIGIPSVNTATIKLGNGNEFSVKSHGTGEKAEKIVFNGNELTARYIRVEEMMNGGILEYYLI